MGQVNLKWINFNLAVNIEEGSIEDQLLAATDDAMERTMVKGEEKPEKEKNDKQKEKEKLGTLRDTNLAEKINNLNFNESIVPEANNDESMAFVETKTIKCECGNNSVKKGVFKLYFYLYILLITFSIKINRT
jgi:hypothetical protein